jgi:hypothetical protein
LHLINHLLKHIGLKTLIVLSDFGNLLLHPEIMKVNKALLVLMLVWSIPSLRSNAACPGQSEIIIQITADNFPQETSWTLKDQHNSILASGNAFGDTLCVAAGTCLIFTIYDTSGDGICCSYGNGSFSVWIDGIQQASGGNFGFETSFEFNCTAGNTCTQAIAVDTLNYTAPQSDSWYAFTPDTTGLYTISTCFPSNICDTKIWIYSACTNLYWNDSDTNTVYYNDNGLICGNQAVLEAPLLEGTTYYIRIGDFGSDCGSSPIDFSIQFSGAISGCTDPAACNYNPFATISSGPCYYYPDANCGAPDLIIDQSTFENSLAIDQLTAQNCWVQDNCLSGYGTRTIIRFSTMVQNIGTSDFFIGNPAIQTTQFDTSACDQLPYYENFVSHTLFKSNGQQVPLGIKKAYCIADISGCGAYNCNNMGISEGCADLSNAGLDCQWVDITDIVPGDYFLVLQVNPNQRADALGRTEVDYTNNSVQVCFSIIIDGNGQKNIITQTPCLPFSDCNGIPYGNAVIDCNGDCGGTTLHGDLNNDSQQDTLDALEYVDGILQNSISPSVCRDLNADNLISVWDALLLQRCAHSGTTQNMACVFPNGVVNPSQTVTLSIDSVNSSLGFIDIAMLNPDNAVSGVEFNLSGLQIDTVLPLYNTTAFPHLPFYLEGGNKIILYSTLDSLFPSSGTFQSLCRVYYSVQISAQMCISEIVHIINSQTESTLTQIGTDCISTTSDINTNVGLLQVWPNPVQSLINIALPDISSNASIEIRNVMGALVYSRNMNAGSMGQTLQIPSLDWSSGIYSIQLECDAKIMSCKVVIIH